MRGGGRCVDAFNSKGLWTYWLTAYNFMFSVKIIITTLKLKKRFVELVKVGTKYCRTLILENWLIDRKKKLKKFNDHCGYLSFELFKSMATTVPKLIGT